MKISSIITTLLFLVSSISAIAGQAVNALRRQDDKSDFFAGVLSDEDKNHRELGCDPKLKKITYIDTSGKKKKEITSYDADEKKHKVCIKGVDTFDIEFEYEKDCKEKKSDWEIYDKKGKVDDAFDDW